MQMRTKDVHRGPGRIPFKKPWGVALCLFVTGCGGMQAVDHGQPGWRVRTDQVDLFITRNGGQMAPVVFNKASAAIQPYYISPWQEEGLQNLPDPVLVPLRGDFFCMPFGANSEAVDGEKYTGHGEPASSPWSLARLSRDQGVTNLTLQLETKIRKGRITKQIFLVDGQNMVYITHRLEGYSGRMPIGHHCTLAVPQEEKSLNVSVSRFDLGSTCPVIFSNPVNREYQSLAIDRPFTDLTKVPTLFADSPLADCSSFPQRTGYTDLIQIFRKPSAQPAWTVACCPSRGYLWFSLKDPAVLPGTVFWISNRGRHGVPWDGRNRCLGLEETCSYFAEGLGPSGRPNKISQAGFPTAIELRPDRPTEVHFIQGVAAIPKDFRRVQSVEFTPGAATFISDTGARVTVKVNHEFLKSGQKALRP